MNPGWINRQYARVLRDVEQSPEWMRSMSNLNKPECMSSDEIARQRAVIVAATAGPWWEGAEDFIAHATAAWPSALDEVERLKAENARLREAGKVLERLGQVASGCFGDLEAYADARNVFKGGE